MYYEINVSLNGQHFFATADRSLHTENQTRVVYAKLREAFPESEGYKLEVTHWQNRGGHVNTTGWEV